jgi:hypothetical protein
VAGFVATAAMVPALYALVSILSGQPLTSAMLGGAVAWMPALVLQFVNGSLTLALAYAYLVYRFLPGAPWIRGALWGFMLWCLTELIVMPLMEDALSGVTSLGATAVLVVGLLLAFLVYGTVLGWLAGGGPPRRNHLREARIGPEKLAA